MLAFKYKTITADNEHYFDLANLIRAVVVTDIYSKQCSCREFLFVVFNFTSTPNQNQSNCCNRQVELAVTVTYSKKFLRRGGGITRKSHQKSLVFFSHVTTFNLCTKTIDAEIINMSERGAPEKYALATG